MRRIAIFGDSFADPVSCSEFNNDLAWPQLLAQRGITIHNYAQSGSSLFYSWKKYYHFRHDVATWPIWNACDAVIFVITGKGREMAKIDGKTYWLTSKNQVEILRNYEEVGSHSRRILDSICDYWEYVKDVDSDEWFHRLLVDKIKSEPKIFYLTAFSSDNELKDRGKMYLGDFSMKELKFWHPNITSYAEEAEFMTKYRDQRKCHLSAENNAAVADKVYDALLRGEQTIEFVDSDLRQPTQPHEYYFKEHDYGN
jgi:hypothetical protein